MNTFKRHWGVLLCSSIAVVSVWACQATRNSDGSWSYSFAPDMTIKAWGLEGALRDLTRLLDKCITGNFSRPCTNDEMDAINAAIDEVLDAKNYLIQPPARSSGTPRA